MDWLTDLAITYYPHIGVMLVVVAGGLTILRKIAPKTKNTIDDEIVAKADEVGATKFLDRFNPFKSKK